MFKISYVSSLGGNKKSKASLALSIDSEGHIYLFQVRQGSILEPLFCISINFFKTDLQQTRHKCKQKSCFWPHHVPPLINTNC